ncbi:DUF922 domain-containing Zn-dependent protease [Consotaella aegiceratis]|uniref:DUF922 domain-containing Zn-dependent protease n=1 Tax=Consotaella aegiceratis TaxID=3097961 RepID=UPI002F3E7C6A
MKVSIICGLALLALWPASSGRAAEIREHTKYFMVRGTSLEELDQELSRHGPVIEGTGMHHPASTEVKFDGRVTYKQTGNRCEVDTANLHLALTITLPKWQPRKAASPEVTLIWKTLESDILRHERRHAEIAKSWLKRTEMAVRNLGTEPTCARMEEKVKATTARYLANHEKAQVDFDKREGREIGWRLRRALRWAVDEASQ